MEKLQIEKSKAVAAYESGDGGTKAILEAIFGRDAFLKKKASERISDFDDVLDELKIDAHEFETSTFGLSPDEIAYRKIKLIAKAYNGEWEPDWNDSSQNKFYPWFDMRGPRFACLYYGFGSTRTDAGSRLCFKRSEYAEDAGRKFLDIYKTFMTLEP